MNLVISITIFIFTVAFLLGMQHTAVWRKCRCWYSTQLEQMVHISTTQTHRSRSVIAEGLLSCAFVFQPAGILLNFFWLNIVGAFILFFPVLAGKYVSRKRHALMNAQMDNMLTNLANAVSVTGNLYNAIEDVAEGEAEPMRSALQWALHEIRLGTTEEDAFLRFAQTSGIPLLKTAISAVIVGKQTGGNLAQILSSTAQGIRDIKRVEGVLKVKTAEARNQAWVMSAVPAVMCGLLHLLNPQWLQPLWETPLGWAIVFLCVALEVCGAMLIRKIMAVQL